jgi:hypothetical protein
LARGNRQIILIPGREVSKQFDPAGRETGLKSRGSVDMIDDSSAFEETQNSGMIIAEKCKK